DPLCGACLVIPRRLLVCGCLLLVLPAGKAGDKPFRKNVAAKHWAFQPIRRPALPAVKDRRWARTPLDLFVLARLEAAGLTPAPEADRATLLRRLSFDLTGLPPAPEEIDAFLADDRPDAYERRVERAAVVEYQRLTDLADTTAEAFAGLTAGCARCHSHKYDPISHEDYFGLQAIFAPSKAVDVPVGARAGKGMLARVLA